MVNFSAIKVLTMMFYNANAWNISNEFKNIFCNFFDVDDYLKSNLDIKSFKVEVKYNG